VLLNWLYKVDKVNFWWCKI